MRVLGIDPGTKCGWAILDDNDRVASGTWDLSVKRGESDGMRFLRLEHQLKKALGCAEAGTLIELVFYEEVKRHLGVYAAHVYGGIVAIITATCSRVKIPYQGILVSQAKIRATGKGNANKSSMIDAANRQWPRSTPYTEDEADALWIALCGQEIYTGESRGRDT